MFVPLQQLSCPITAPCLCFQAHRYSWRQWTGAWEAVEEAGLCKLPGQNHPGGEPGTPGPIPPSPVTDLVTDERGWKRMAAWHLVNKLSEKNLNCQQKLFSLLWIICDFIYLLNYFSPTWLQKMTGRKKAWSNLSRAPRNMHPGNNLLLTVPGLLLASKQLSRSTEALPGWACTHSYHHLTVRWGGIRRSQLTFSMTHTTALFQLRSRRGSKKESFHSFHMPPPALSAYSEGKAMDPMSL